MIVVVLSFALVYLLIVILCLFALKLMLPMTAPYLGLFTSSIALSLGYWYSEITHRKKLEVNLEDAYGNLRLTNKRLEEYSHTLEEEVEKRTGELNVKYQDTQRQVGSLESQTRDLNAELEALRDQLNRSHDELARVRDGGMEGSDDLKIAEPSISEFGLDDLDFKDSDLAKLESDLDFGGHDAPLESMPEATSVSMTDGGFHTVAKGETLYRLSKEYGVTVDDLKAWNNLIDNTIHVGQQLVVSK